MIIALALGSGAIGALVKKLREQAEKKRAQDVRVRAELERLRTGRDPEQPAGPGEAMPPPEPMAAEPELVRKRREHIERLRRGSQGQATETVVIQVPGAGPVVISRPVPQPRPPVMRPGPSRREPKRKAKPVAPPPPPARPPHVLTPTESTTIRRVAEDDFAASSPTPGVAGTVTGTLPRTREEWRRLVVMREVLSPPLSMREP